MPRPFTLHRPSEDDWQAIRDLRLRAVTDTPIAFLETREEVLAVDEDGWRTRVRRNVAEDSTQVVAIADDGRWIGSMVCFVSEGSPGYVTEPRPGPRRANLVGVFVDPDWRGDAGVTDALLAGIGRWVAEDKGLAELFLHVSAENPRAIRSYLKRGFRETGVVDTVPDRPDDREVEMVATLPLAVPLAD
jgi:RimJ/RimL family protein N-acetyltransferase